MNRTIAALLLAPVIAAAQDAPSRLSVRVTSDATPVAQAHVIAGDQTVATSAAGVARIWLKRGPQLVIVRAIGYKPDSIRITMTPRDTMIAVELHPAAEELEQMFVTSTRGVKRLEDEPTRIEVLGGDDVAEKTEMRPQDLKGFLAEMAGVRMQTTSAATGAAGVRLQGLKSRYSLILADGLPLYGSGGNGLDLLQMPPVDLRQIEVVKGPASALYGANALGGTINLVSKRPGDETDVLVHGTSEGGSNGFGWVSKKVSDRFGYTGVIGVHRQGSGRDTDGDNWMEVPKVTRYEARPRFYFETPGGASGFITVGATSEDRVGGFANGLAPDNSLYIERAQTNRGDVGFTASTVAGEAGVVQLRGSFNINAVDWKFGTVLAETRRSTGFGELSYSLTRPGNELLAGVALQADKALTKGPSESSASGIPVDYVFLTPALFAQDSWSPVEKVSLIASGRADMHSEYGTFLSPRLSLLYKPIEDWSVRLSATRGFFAPTPFIEEADQFGPHAINGFRSNDPRTLKAETANYGSADLHGTLGPVELNATLFASIINNPVIAAAAPGGRLDLSNGTFGNSAKGAELFAVYDLDPLFITALYTYTDARERADITSEVELAAPYTPRHTGGIDVTWEDAKRGTWIAVESFFTSRQRLVDDPTLEVSKPYAVTGILFSQKVGRFKLFANVENLADVRQTNYAPLVRPAQSRRSTADWTVTPWAPLEGRTFSVGLRVHSGGEK